MIYIVTDRDSEVERCERLLGRHGVAPRPLATGRFSEADLPVLFAATPGLRAVLRVHTSLRAAGSDAPPGPLQEAVEGARVEVWRPGAARVYERAVRGWLDAEGVFRAAGTGLSEAEALARGLRRSALDLALAEFVVEHLYLPERADLAHSPQRPRETVAFDDGVAELLREHPWLAGLPDPGPGSLLAHVAAEGAFFRAAQSRRERNYWLPGLNAGVPYTPKDDPVHELTYLVHDLAHLALPDLVFTGRLGPDPGRARVVYGAWRMIAEAASMVVADMLFVEALRAKGVDYDWSRRRIHPLYARCALPADPGEALEVLVHANARFALFGDDGGFRALAGGDGFEEALAAYTARYERYFRADYRWTFANFDEMASRAPLFERWAALVGEARLSSLGLRTLEGLLGELAALPTEALPEALTRRAVAELRARCGASAPPSEPAQRMERAARRWALGQCMMFVVWDFLPGAHAMARTLLSTIDGPLDPEAILRLRRWMDERIEALHEAGWISDDDRRTWQGLFPLFEPRYVYYDRAEDGAESLAELGRRLLSAPVPLARREEAGLPCVDPERLFAALGGLPPAARLRALLEAAGVGWHDEARDFVAEPAVALVAVGGLPVRFVGEALHLGDFRAPSPTAALRSGQRAAMGAAAAITYLNPRDLPFEALFERVVGQGHGSILHLASLTFLVAGISTAVENELNGQRDLVHLARLTEARTAAQADPPLCVLDARDLPLFQAVLAAARAGLAAEAARDPDRQESRHLAFPAAKATAVLVTGSLRSFQRLVAAREDPGREREYRRMLQALNRALGALHPDLFPP